MKRIFKIITSCLLLVAIVCSSLMIFAEAEVPLRTTEQHMTTEATYYNLKDGLYTYKSIAGPNANGEYDITIDTYTSDVSVISGVESEEIDITFVVDMSSSVIGNEVNQLKDSMRIPLKTLTQNYNVGTNAGQYRINVSIIRFHSNSKVLISHVPLNEQNRTSTIESAINAVDDGSGGLKTFTGDGMRDAYNLAQNRDNKQIVILMTDGVPGTLPGFGTGIENGWPIGLLANGNEQANRALEYSNKLKKAGATIFTLGIGADVFKYKPDYNTSVDGLKMWTDCSESIRIKQVGVLLNACSSNWKAINNRNYTWENTGSWKGLYKDYTLDVPEYSKGFALTASDFSAIEQEITSSLVKEVSTTYISQGNLISDFSIIDSVTQYFETVPDSLAVFQIPYAPNNGTYEINLDGNLGQWQYGANSRAWSSTSKDITSAVNYTMNNNGIEISGFKTSDASIVDSFVIEDDFIAEQPVHKGNKLRVTYKVRPKDAFMGGHNISIANESNSYIYDISAKKPLQYFYNMTLSKNASGELIENLVNEMGKFTVSLPDGTVSVDSEDVKIGFIYDTAVLGNKNLVFKYKGRNSNTIYEYKYKDGLIGVFSGSQTYPYANDFVTHQYGSEVSNNDSDILSYKNYIQPNATGVTRNGIADKKISKNFYLRFDIPPVGTPESILENINESKSTGNEIIVLPGASEGLAGAANDTFYYLGYKIAKEYDVDIKLNVFVPLVTSYDIVLNSQENAIWPVDSTDATNAFKGYTVQNVISNPNNLDNDTLSYLMTRKSSANTSVYNINNNLLMTDVITPYVSASDIDKDGITETRFAELTSKNNAIELKRYDTDETTDFAKDVLSLNSENIKANGYAKEFVNSSNSLRKAGDIISEGDKVKLTLIYEEMISRLSALSPTGVYGDLKQSPFKLTVDEFFTYSDCRTCNEGSSPERQVYQIKAHISNDFITISKTGCDENHTQDSFVFTVIGVKENSAGNAPDTDTAKILTTIAIHGNGQVTIPISTSEYQYYKVVEDTIANEDKAWSWTYNDVTMNGAQDLGWADLENNLIKLKANDSYLFAFTNTFDTNKENLHYSSRYCTNILSADSETISTNSYDTIVKNEAENSSQN